MDSLCHSINREGEESITTGWNDSVYQGEIGVLLNSGSNEDCIWGAKDPPEAARVEVNGKVLE